LTTDRNGGFEVRDAAPADRSSATLIGPTERFDEAAEALGEQGWWAGEATIESALLSSLISELNGLREADRLERAGIGRDLDFQLDRDVRRDFISWINRGSSPVQARLLDHLEQLRIALNRRLFLGLFEFEGHFAHYPPGGFYRRHRDSFRGAANRLVSLVIYLNEHWQAGDGGELVLYTDDEQAELATIEPRAGTLALFLSEEVPHEVRPAGRDRLSIAGWFRLNSSVNGVIDPPR